MREVDVWRNASDAEFENAMEGMEKLVMNRLYDLYVPRFPLSLALPLKIITSAYSIFTPQVARAVPPRPVTTDDLERDRVLAQRIALFGWIEPAHLDVPVGEGTNGFLMFAQQGVYPLITVMSVAMMLMELGRADQGQPLQGAEG